MVISVVQVLKLGERRPASRDSATAPLTWYASYRDQNMSWQLLNIGA